MILNIIIRFPFVYAPSVERDRTRYSVAWDTMPDIEWKRASSVRRPLVTFDDPEKALYIFQLADLNNLSRDYVLDGCHATITAAPFDYELREGPHAGRSGVALGLNEISICRDDLLSAYTGAVIRRRAQ